VLVSGPVTAPKVLDRRRIELCDPGVPASTQPYHAGMGKLQIDETKVDRLRKVIQRAADRSVQMLLDGYRQAGHSIVAAGLVVGSDIDPARITNPHIRAHALEGRLFRGVLEDALQSRDLKCSVIVERHIYEQAAKTLHRSDADLKRWLTQLGQALDGPWRSDEKTACLAALLALA
jgi:hypothetical protein